MSVPIEIREAGSRKPSSGRMASGVCGVHWAVVPAYEVAVSSPSTGSRCRIVHSCAQAKTRGRATLGSRVKSKRVEAVMRPKFSTVRTQSSGAVGHAAESHTPRKIGLIGGLAFRAGVFYYDQLAQRYSTQNRRLELTLSHADVGTVLACVNAGDNAELGEYLGSLANALFDAGADLVAVTAVAPHFAICDIARVAKGPIVSVLDSILGSLQAAGIERVAVFGNRVVIETDVFGIIPTEMIVPLERSQIEEIHTSYNDIALTGKRGTQHELQLLERVARDVLTRGAQTILLAGTDLSSFYAGKPPTYPSVDVAQLHIDDIIHRAQAK